jgi:uncharacterized protein YegL
MSGFVADTIGGYNTFIDEQKKLPGDAKITTVLFDTEYDVFEDGVELQKAVPLSRISYVPRGNTALLDAIGDAVKRVEDRQAKLPDDQKTDHVIMVIITDGQENSSVRFSKDQIKDIITAKTALGWKFDFFSANMDAINDATRSYGFDSKNVLCFAANTDGFQKSYKSMNISTSNYRLDKDS